MATQRGRKSAGKLAAVEPTAPQRPAPPEGMPAEQAVIWVRVVNALRPEWFGKENLDLLQQYCRHVVASNDIDAMIQTERKKRKPDPAELDFLYKMQDREGKALATLATRMRISQQSSYDPQLKKQAKSAPKWADKNRAATGAA